MLYVRGNKRDYDEWQELGNPTWSWENVLKYFKKSENNHSPILSMDPIYHSVKGELNVTTWSFEQSLKQIIFDSFRDLGIDQILDGNGNRHLGFGIAQGTVYEGTRQSAGKAFLSTIKTRKNLQIVKQAHVTKINFDKNLENPEIEFILNGKQINVKPSKEIILSAGAIGSPHILLNSGIGPEESMEKLNKKCLLNLPVGHNLQDHVWVPYILTVGKSTTDAYSEIEQSFNMFNYLQTKAGPLASIGASAINAFISTVHDPKYPDIEIIFLNWQRNDPSIVPFFESTGLRDEIIQSIKLVSQHNEVLVVMIALLNPESRGKITLNSANNLDYPLIYPNYFSDSKDSDINTILRGIHFARELTKTKAFKDNDINVIKVKIPECDQYHFDSDDYWKCYSRFMSTTLYHPSGTTKMGPDSDTDAVVDSRLRLRGVKGVRVADTGIMPKIISGNTNAPTIMIGEKTADFVKEDWAKKN